MAHSNKPTPWAREVVRLLRQVVTDDDGNGLPAISHRLPIVTPDSRAPAIFTLDLSPDQHGTFLVICREVPDIVLFAETEEEGLTKAEQAIRETLVVCRSSPDFPY